MCGKTRVWLHDSTHIMTKRMVGSVAWCHGSVAWCHGRHRPHGDSRHSGVRMCLCTHTRMLVSPSLSASTHVHGHVHRHVHKHVQRYAHDRISVAAWLFEQHLWHRYVATHMRIDTCVNMCIDMWTDIRVGVCIDMCKDRYVCRHVCRHVRRHASRHV